MVPFPTPNRRRVYLMRHGAVTYFDETGRPVPSPEAVPLNELGRSQTTAAGKIFAAENIVFDRVIVIGPSCRKSAAASWRKFPSTNSRKPLSARLKARCRKTGASSTARASASFLTA
jgi:phosphohistidine phosphatase SixA